MEKVITRAKAQSIIASTLDATKIEPFLKHGNAHVQAYAKHKLANLPRLLAAKKELEEREAAAAEKATKERARKDRKNAKDRERRARQKAEREAAKRATETEAA